MKAIIKTGEGEENTFFTDEAPEPKIAPGCIKIKVKAATICGSDLHVYHSELKMKENRYRYPVILGHEGSGEIVEIGQGVTDYEVGDRVVSETTFSSCMQCEYCYESMFNCCDSRLGLGSAVNGFFAEYVLVPMRSVHKIPDHISYEAAAMMEPLACAVHGVLNRSNVEAGNIAVIIGPGPIGLLTAQVAKAAGCVVVVCGRSSSMKRLKFAKEVLGIQHVIDTTAVDVKTYVSKLTHGRMADIIYECSGSPEAISEGFQIVKKHGQFVGLGTYADIIEFPYRLLIYEKEITIAGVRSTVPSSWDKALRLVDYGLVNLEPMVSNILPLEKWKEGYKLFENKNAIKVVLKP